MSIRFGSTEPDGIMFGGQGADALYLGSAQVWQRIVTYRFAAQANPPDLAGQYNQFAAVCQVNAEDSDGRDFDGAMVGATDVPVLLASDGGSTQTVLPLIDYAGNGHVRLNGAGTDAVHTFSGELRITDLRGSP